MLNPLLITNLGVSLLAGIELSSVLKIRASPVIVVLDTVTESLIPVTLNIPGILRVPAIVVAVFVPPSVIVLLAPLPLASVTFPAAPKVPSTSTLSGNPIVIVFTPLASVTAVAISFAVPAILISLVAPTG